MKLLIIFITLMPVAFGATCDEKPGKPHTNPDNSVGGFVADTAKVEVSAFVDSTSSVCDQAQVSGTVRVAKNSIVAEKATIEGRAQVVNSRVSGIARVSGSSVVSDSQVCQMSQISGFNVINSEYYCQTGDPAPKDPGASGELTVLGVDSDADGVRDDVEILINNLTSNTPGKDNKEVRAMSKEYARILQQETLHKNNKAKLSVLLLQKTNVLACDEILHKVEIFEQMYNTEGRLYALFKVLGQFHGDEVVSPTRKCVPVSK